MDAVVDSWVEENLDFFRWLTDDEDKAQDLIVAVLKMKNLFDPNMGDIRNWIRNCIWRKLKNSYIDMWRRGKTRATLPLEMDIKRNENKTFNLQLSELYCSLSDQESWVLDLLREGKNHTEIGTVIGVSQQRVSKIVKNIRQKAKGIV